MRCTVILLCLMLGTTFLDAKPMDPLPEMKFMHRVVLDKEGDYIMMWTPREEDLVFEVQVATTGYVGLGFSPNGGMAGADIILGWVDDKGEVFLHDRYATGYSEPAIDKSQDVKLLGGYQNDTHTVLRFVRPWQTCDSEDDLPLTDNTIRIIWAYSFEDPPAEEGVPLQRHYHRGTKSLYLNEPRFTLPSLPDDVQTWDLMAQNLSLPNDLDTLYWCKIYKIPELPQKVHVIGYVPLVQKENVDHVHHIVVHECVLPDGEEDHFEQWLEIKGAQCYGQNMPVSWTYCRTPLLAWAVGSDGEMFPDHVGFPIGNEHGGSSYFLMELHYDNPNLRQDIVDSSGIRLFFTEKLRENEAANVAIGSDVSGNVIIPPGQDWHTVGHCISECTKSVLPPNGINVFHGLLHAHLLGKSLKLRQIRDGKELPTVFRDMSYDFNYQQVRILKEEMKILPGDHLIMECGYDSKKRVKPTFGGLGTDEEMCIAFLSYYPRTNISMCSSRPSIKNIYESLGVEDIYYRDRWLNFSHDLSQKINKEKDKQLVQAMKEGTIKSNEMKLWHMHKMIKIKSPEKYANTTLFDILSQESIWQDSNWITQLQNLSTKGRHHVTCAAKKYKPVKEIPAMVDYPSFIPYEPEEKKCDIKA